MPAPHDTVPGWFAPVYGSLSQPILTAGVPSDYFMPGALVSLMVSLFWPPIVMLVGVVYAAARRLTSWDPLWFGILCRYLSYAARYQGR